MKNWPERLRLLAVLATTKSFLSHSEREGWGIEYPREAEQEIDRIIDCIFFDRREPLPDHWQVLYAPTGPLQEISIANGWSEAYLKLSEEFDFLEHILNGHQAGAEPALEPDA